MSRKCNAGQTVQSLSTEIAEALHTHPDSLQVIFDNIADVVYLLDVEPDGYRFAAINRAFLTATGLTPSRVLGQRVEDVIPKPSLEGVLARYARAAQTGQPMHWEETSEYPAGTRYGEVMVAPVLDAHGRCTQLVGTVHDVTERREAEARLHQLAHYDALSGLPNRRHLGECLEREIARAAAGGPPVALMYLDLDGFKEVNDALGHGLGDALLCEVARRLLTCTRGRDHVGRLGGDEFGIVATIGNGPREPAAIARHVVECLREPFQIDGHEITVTTSLGIATCPGDACDAEAIMRCADVALYHAKAAGRNTFAFYHESMNAWARERRELEQALRQAVQQDEFELAFQPQVSLADGRWVGAEALLRWQRPGHGQVMPADFIGVLEDTGLIVQAGRWVIEAACAQLAAWHALGMHDFTVSVNMSARQVQLDYQRSGAMGALGAGVDAHVAACLRTHGLAAGALGVELTETALMTDVDKTAELLGALRALGVQVQIDDFGTGYSSLMYLKRFPVNVLKIDREFVRDLEVDEGARTITRAIINLAHNLQLAVIAEGVETEAQLQFLKAHGCDFAQGYLFARPGSAAALTAQMPSAADARH